MVLQLSIFLLFQGMFQSSVESVAKNEDTRFTYLTSKESIEVWKATKVPS